MYWDKKGGREVCCSVVATIDAACAERREICVWLWLLALAGDGNEPVVGVQ